MIASTSMLAKGISISDHQVMQNLTGSSSPHSQVGLDPIAAMNNNFALIYGRSEIWDIENRIAMKIDAFRHLMPKSAKLWLESSKRRTIMPGDIVFSPGGCDPNQINIFDKRKMLKPDSSKSCTRLLEHLWNMCGKDLAMAEFLLGWLAWPLQHPGAKMATAIVVHGKQGTGKNLFFEAYAQIFGPYATVLDQDTLESNFNGWASGKMFVIADEVISNANKANVRNKLKSMITGTTININRKGIEAREEANHMNMVFLSNALIPLLLENDDRRYCVIRFDDLYDPQYYKNLADEIKAGGVQGLYNFLLHWNFRNFSGPHQKPILNVAKQNLVEQCLTTPEKFMKAWLAGELPVLPQAVKAGELFDLYKIWCVAANERPVSQTRFGGDMRDLCAKHRIAGGGFCYVPPNTPVPQNASAITSISLDIMKYSSAVRNRDNGL